MALKPLNPPVPEPLPDGWSYLGTEARRSPHGVEVTIRLYHDKNLIDMETVALGSKRQRRALVSDFASKSGLDSDILEKALLPLADNVEGKLREMEADESLSLTQSALAELIAQEKRDTFAYDLTHQQWMQYDITYPGIWGSIEPERADKQVRESLNSVLPKGFSWSLLQGVQHLLRTHLHRTFPVAGTAWLPCRDGALELATMTQHAHTPERGFTWCLPYRYDPNATCPETQKFLHQALKDNHDQVQVIRAFLKAVILGRVDLQRYMELLGPAGTGKGTVLRLAQALVGYENICVTELKHLESNRFETSNLLRKRLITITDAEHYNGQVSTLKAMTGGDVLRMEEKFKRQTQAVAEGMVMIAANEPIQSSDYTSGLERRRLTIPFVARPTVPRDLLSLHGDHFEGDLAAELPGTLNWILALPDSLMEALIVDTKLWVRSLDDSWTHTLVATNPLAEWANQALCVDLTPGSDGKKRSINVGIAKKTVDRFAPTTYDYEGIWLYPTYRAYVDATAGKPLSHRRFAGLLRDLLEHQLRLDGVEHRDDNQGSRFTGLRFRTKTDVKRLVAVPQPAPVTVGTVPVTVHPLQSDSCDGCTDILSRIYEEKQRLVSTGQAPIFSPIGGFANKLSQLSHPPPATESDGEQPSQPSLKPSAQMPVSHNGVNAALTVGSWIEPVSQGMVQPYPGTLPPYQITAIEVAADGSQAAVFLHEGTRWYWPLAQCERTTPLSTPLEDDTDTTTEITDEEPNFDDLPSF
jgi:phage/plasmid-associated DNA primase